jgi:hypothetical protein
VPLLWFISATMIYQLLAVGASCVVLTNAVSIKSLQKKTRVGAPKSVDQIPSSFQEAGYADEDFAGFSQKQKASRARMTAPVQAREAQVITKFHTLNFYDHGYEFEPAYEGAASLVETSSSTSAKVEAETEVEHPQFVGLPTGDFHKDSKFTIGVVPASYKEAIYWDSPATSFFEEEESEVHNVLQPLDIPESFIEAGYDDDSSFFKKDPSSADFSREHRFTIGFAPNTYKEALYWDSPAAAFFEESEDPSEVGEDFRISPHGRTEDVNNPDYEINHPTVHKHSKNVIGTKQEGHLFWTDTTQPNPDTYESTFDKSVRLANSVGGDDQAFSVQEDEDNTNTPLDCAGCPTPP